MEEERYRRLQTIFLDAVELEGDAQRELLERECAGDPELRRGVERLLARDEEHRAERGGGVMDRIGELVADVVKPDAEPSGSSPPIPLPDRIGHYRILELIGEGGMGKVYLAEQEHPRRYVALKMIRPEAFSPGLYRRFLFEAELLGRLHHPGIAQIHEAGEIETEHGPLPFFAMEYVEGTELRRYVERHDLDVRERLELLARVCDAVHHAHQHGIVHRDLKPDNVLVVDASEATPAAGGDGRSRIGQPKVLDFGVARAIDSDVQLTTMRTDAGHVIGTLAYMSPEQLAGDSRRLDTRSDIYALGTLIYEVLAGRPPFDLSRKPIPAAALVVLEEEPTSLGSIDSGFRGDIETIVGKALEKDRERRYSSAAELAADLRRYLHGNPIAAHPPSTFYQLRKLARRHQGLVAGLAVAFLVLVAGTITSLILAARAVRGEERALQSEAVAIRTARRLSLTAAEAVGDTDPLRALEHLEAVPEELRGWEWRHLFARFTPRVTEQRADERWLGDPHDVRLYRLLQVTARGPDDSLLAVLVREEGVELVDLLTGEVLGRFGEKGDEAVATISADGSCLAIVSRTRETLSAWRTRPAELLFEMPVVSAELIDVCFSPDGSLLVLSTGEGARVLETAGGRCRFDTAPYPTEAGAVRFTADGSRFVLLGKNWGEERCDFAEFIVCTYTTEGECLEHDLVREKTGWGVESLALGPEGRRLAVGRSQRAVQIFDRERLEEETILYGHTDAVSAVAFSPDGSLLASASLDGTVCLWDLVRERTSSVVPGLATAPGISSLTFSQDGKRLAGGNYLGACTWDFEVGARRVLEGHASYVYRVVFSPDGSLIASGGWDGSVRLWDVRTGEPLAILRAGDARHDLCFTPDGSRLVGCAVWDPAAGIELEKPRRPGDEELLAEPAEDARLLPHSLRVGRGGSKRARTGEVFASSHDRSRVAEGLSSGAVLIRDLVTGASLMEIGGPSSPALAVAFSPDGTRLVVGYEDGTSRVWALERGVLLATLTGHASQVYTVNYSPDGARLVSGGNDCTIVLWDADSWEQTAVLRGHTSYVHSVCFSPDGTTLASASGDGTVRLWDSVPAAERWQELRRDEAQRGEVSPRVDDLLRELGNPLDVADRLRDDDGLSDEQRAAALRVLLARSAHSAGD